MAHAQRRLRWLSPPAFGVPWIVGLAIAWPNTPPQIRIAMACLTGLIPVMWFLLVRDMRRASWCVVDEHAGVVRFAKANRDAGSVPVDGVDAIVVECNSDGDGVTYRVLVSAQGVRRTVLRCGLPGDRDRVVAALRAALPRAVVADG
jgi:hypothetical protein